uniref:Uncharacterized protein n=1 Tax=Anguilla anguilla TaxID=7936 RepID=A0A0E9PVC8_ANGAN
MYTHNISKSVVYLKDRGLNFEEPYWCFPKSSLSLKHTYT